MPVASPNINVITMPRPDEPPAKSIPGECETCSRPTMSFEPSIGCKACLHYAFLSGLSADQVHHYSPVGWREKYRDWLRSISKDPEWQFPHEMTNVEDSR